MQISIREAHFLRGLRIVFKMQSGRSRRYRPAVYKRFIGWREDGIARFNRPRNYPPSGLVWETAEKPPPQRNPFLAQW